MSYRHIPNLHKDPTVLMLFRRLFAVEKVDGTHAQVRYGDADVHLSSGSASLVTFTALFDLPELKRRFEALGFKAVSIHGEAYGGKQQKLAHRYGVKLRFVAFDVKVDEKWLTVPEAHALCEGLGIEFAHYVEVDATIEALDAERDAPSEQARRNGIEGDQPREGVVLRPLIELTNVYGERLAAKHKRAEDSETATPREVNPAQAVVLTEATAIATEWVTPKRLEHVLDKLPQGLTMAATKDVIAAMTEDVLREGAGEIVDSKEARNAIGRRTVELFKAHLNAQSAGG